jgi:hypothetical protein
MAEAARAGFRSVVNNRPDFEHGAGQPTSAAIEAAARAAGLEYRHLPVSGAYQSPEQIAAFAELLRRAATPDAAVLPLRRALGAPVPGCASASLSCAAPAGGGAWPLRKLPATASRAAA